jgi:hypothetical protein
MRRLFLALVLAAVPLPVLAASPGYSLAPGDAVFWSGPHVESSTGESSWTYELETTEPAYRLRVAIDHPEPGDNFTVEITDPVGATGSLASGQGLYSAEYRKSPAAAGTWKIVVTAAGVTDSAFRLRAKLEERPPSLGVRKGLVLPNLQVLPPHEASFLQPVTNGSTADNSIGVDLLGRQSCHPEENVEERAIRCLRFGFGIRNTGLGPMDLFNTGAAGQDQPLVQRIQRAEGGHVDRPAGIARYHKTHAHYHHNDAVALRLFKVTDAKAGELEPAGAKHFKGFHHRDELLRDWDRFYPTWAKSGYGLLSGWADIYEWDRPGNYIDFGLNGDGLYVVRMWADPVGGIREANERDNVGYTYLEVSGSTVELLEAGRGSDPWDTCKIEVGFGGYPDPDAAARPAQCPEDTA